MKLSQYISITIALIVTASSAFAQTSSIGALPDGTNTVQINPEVKEDDKRFSLDLWIEMSEKIAREEKVSKENSTSLMIAPAYKLNNLLTLGGRIFISQDNFGQRDTTVSDGIVSLGIKGYTFTSYLKSTHALGTVIPAAEKTIKDDRLKGNISVTNGITFEGTYITASYKLGISRNFHEFTQNREGNANVEYRLSQIVDLKIPITEQFSLTSTGIYKIGRTYKGFERYAYVFYADLNYEIIKNLTVNAGTTNDAAALKSNGSDSNIALFDDKSSAYRAGVAYSY